MSGQVGTYGNITGEKFIVACNDMDRVELRLRDTFPVHKAETVDGVAVAPADWDDPEDNVYDALA